MARQLGWLSTSFPMSGASHFGCWQDLSEGGRAIRGALLLFVRGGAIYRRASWMRAISRIFSSVS
jgi:hypothetical protein